MKDLFMFKVTQTLQNEEEKEVTSLFGFKLISKQIQLFAHRGELPTAHMVGHALRNSGILDKYERRHLYRRKWYGENDYARASTGGEII